MRHALGERVNPHEQQARHAVVQTAGRELQQKAQAGETLRGGEDDGGAGREGAAGEGAEAGAGDVGVEVAVPEVVDGAAGGAHDEGAGEEEQRGGEGVGRGRGGVGGGG